MKACCPCEHSCGGGGLYRCEAASRVIPDANWGTKEELEECRFPAPPEWCPILKAEAAAQVEAAAVQAQIKNLQAEKRDILRNYEDAFRLLEQRNKELLEALQGMLGVFDTPIARRAFSNDFSEEAIRDAEEAIHKTKTGDKIVVTADPVTGEVRSKLVFTLESWEQEELAECLRNEDEDDENG